MKKKIYIAIFLGGILFAGTALAKGKPIKESLADIVAAIEVRVTALEESVVALTTRIDNIELSSFPNCPEGTAPYSIEGNLVYCLNMVDVPNSNNRWSQCVEECGKNDLYLSTINDLALVCKADETVFDGYTSEDTFRTDTFLFNSGDGNNNSATSKTYQVFMPAATHDPDNQSFCELVDANYDSHIYYPFYFSGGYSATATGCACGKRL